MPPRGTATAPPLLPDLHPLPPNPASTPTTAMAVRSFHLLVLRRRLASRPCFIPQPPTPGRDDPDPRYLPEALAHSASLALLSAFPKSKPQFDAAFRRKLFTTFVHWTSG